MSNADVSCCLFVIESVRKLCSCLDCIELLDDENLQSQDDTIPYIQILMHPKSGHLRPIRAHCKIVRVTLSPTLDKSITIIHPNRTQFPFWVCLDERRLIN